MIKAVLFDYGGVLTEGGTKGCVQRIFGSIYGVPPSAIDQDSDLLVAAAMGTIAEDDFFTEMNRRHFHSPRATREKYLAGADIFAKSKPVYDLAARLKQHGIATGILSNINDIAAHELRRRGLYQGFDPVVLSFEEHLAKPDRRFYQIALDRLGLAANEVVLVDDQEKCRPPAEALGMHFILAVSPQQIVADIKALLQKENQLTIGNI